MSNVSLNAQTAPEKPNCKVLLSINVVKENSKADFEKWMRDVFKPAIKMKLEPSLTKLFKGFRYLTPAKQNDDKTWDFCFLFDPIVPEADYSLENFLIKNYGLEKGKAYMQQYNSYMANDGHAHEMNEDSGFYKD